MIDSKPLISVVVTTYNAGNYLKPQLDSILHQTYTHLEIIIADDCSTDGTVETLKDYANKDPRIKLICHETNLGFVKNLEDALSHTKGELIAISDQDDIWELDKLTLLQENLGDASAIYSDSQIINGEGEFSGFTVLNMIRVNFAAEGNDPLLVLHKNHVSGHALLFNRDILLLPFSERFIYDHQLAFLALAHKGLKFFNKPLVRHRIHGKNQVNGSLDREPKVSLSVVQKLKSKTTGQNKKIKQNVPSINNAVTGDQLDSMIDLKISRRKERVLLLTDSLDQMQTLLQRKGLERSLVGDKLIILLKQYDHRFFSLRLFFLLLRYRRSIFYGQNYTVKNCFRLSKGKYYYEWIKRLSPFQ